MRITCELEVQIVRETESGKERKLTNVVIQEKERDVRESRWKTHTNS